MKGRYLGQVLIVKGSTSLRRSFWLQVNFNDVHCPVAHFGVSNGRSWPEPDFARGMRKLTLADRAIMPKIVF